jgi:pyridinium-3,5-bisthiocarboxylic acid mononucleotide nickel chelatase
VRAAFIDMIGGASGNMLFGAFVDAGADFETIVGRLQTIPIGGWTIVRERTQRRGVGATYIDVVVPGEDDHVDHAEAHRHPPGRRTFPEVVKILDDSKLSDVQKNTAVRIATSLARAEAAQTGIPLPQLRFHPIGQVDAIVDIAATSIAVELLGIERLFCSPLPVGQRLPGETAALIETFPRRSETIDAEMVTTTAAAILATLVAEPGLRPQLSVELSGYGAGRSDFPFPNVTRVEIGELL